MKWSKNIIVLLMIACMFISANCSQVFSKENTACMSSNDVSITIKAQTIDSYEKTIMMDYESAKILMSDLKNLQIDMEIGEIVEKEYLRRFLEIFRNSGILPEEYSIEFFYECAKTFHQSITSSVLYEAIQRIGRLGVDFFERNTLQDVYDGIPLHIGRATIIGSISFGNYLVKRVIPFKPYGFNEVFSKELFLDYNLSSYFTFASACIWIPGPRGNHVLFSFYPYMGLESFSQKRFIDKSIGGIFILGANISIEAFSNDGKDVLFDATIGVYGADIMIGFGT
ncbi:MAG: hypothetical protein V1769_05885 [Thermoplasmatota archaeon]